MSSRTPRAAVVSFEDRPEERVMASVVAEALLLARLGEAIGS